MCPHLESLILTNNKITKLEEITKLGQTCGKSLLRLSLVGNLVSQLPNYRQYTIYKLPNLRTLDFQKVSLKERQAASAFFESTPQGQTLLKEIESGTISAQLESSTSKKDKMAGKKRSAIEVERQRKIEEISLKIDHATSLQEVQSLQK